MVFVTAAIAIGAMIFGFVSVTGLASFVMCGRSNSDDENKSHDSSKAPYDPSSQPSFHVTPNDPYYFTEPIVPVETLPFLKRDAQLRHGYVPPPEI